MGFNKEHFWVNKSIGLDFGLLRTEDGWKIAPGLDNVLAVRDDKTVIIAGSGAPAIFLQGPYKNWPLNSDEVSRRIQQGLPLPSDLLAETIAINAARARREEAIRQYFPQAFLYRTSKGRMGAMIGAYETITGRVEDAFPRAVVSREELDQLLAIGNDFLVRNMTVGISLCGGDPWASSDRNGSPIEGSGRESKERDREGLMFFYPIYNLEELVRARQAATHLCYKHTKIEEFLITGHPNFKDEPWAAKETRHTAARLFLTEEGLIIEFAPGYHTREIGTYLYINDKGDKVQVAFGEDPPATCWARGLVAYRAPWQDLEAGLPGEWEPCFSGAWWQQNLPVVKNAKKAIELMMGEIFEPERWQAFLKFAGLALLTGHDSFEFMAAHPDTSEGQLTRINWVRFYQMDGAARLML
ncbi:hypothetical protein KKD62_03220 [Patescibacteria group bacterium]|nr:hypothetical protein [Patescibacteria group bacterium]MBU1931527.1 hypothetical protein [Patescibacteria group bacterium]